MWLSNWPCISIKWHTTFFREFIEIGVSFRYEKDLPLELISLRIINSSFISILISSILMCMTSGAFAINKLRSTDPADIF